MKAQFGVAADSGLPLKLITSAVNVSDISQTHALLHGNETAPRLSMLAGVENRLVAKH
jgi:IS5 family transposase